MSSFLLLKILIQAVNKLKAGKVYGFFILLWCALVQLTSCINPAI